MVFLETFWHLTQLNINIFQCDQVYSFSTIKLHILCLLYVNFSLNVDYMAKNRKNCTKSAIYQFATFTQLQSLKKLVDKS